MTFVSNSSATELSTSDLRRNSATECDIASTRLQRRGANFQRVRDRSQFPFRNGEVRTAAIQANQKLREYPNPRFVQILETGEMDDHLRGEFSLIARPA